MDWYARFFQRGLLPAYDQWKSRRLGARWNQAERTQWWEPERIRELQWEKTRRLLGVAMETVPFYQRKYRGIALGDIRGWKEFAQLPALTREEVEHHRSELRSTLIPASECHEHATGGSSGRPVRFLRTLESYDWRMAMSWRTYSWTGWAPGEKIAYLWGAPVGRQSWKCEWKTRVFDWIYNQRTITTFARTEELWDQTWQRLLRWDPPTVAGYVSSLTSFARYLLARGRGVPSVRRVIAAAEPCDGAQKELIQRAFGAPLYLTYGSREFMSIGGECDERRGLHTAAENLLVETEAAAGSPGEILVTDFHNLGTVFLRYRIGDVGTLSARRCGCGRGLPLLESVEGRSGHTIDFPDGRQLTGILFRHVLKEVPEVAEFQVVQDLPDHIVLNLVLKHPLSEQGEGLVRKEMEKYLGPNRFEIRPVEEPSRGPSGKAPAVVPYRARDLLRR
jgi:phenylacetate-CoA ligase